MITKSVVSLNLSIFELKILFSDLEITLNLSAMGVHFNDLLRVQSRFCRS